MHCGIFYRRYRAEKLLSLFWMPHSYGQEWIELHEVQKLELQSLAHWIQHVTRVRLFEFFRIAEYFYVIICLHARAWQWHRGLRSRILQITGSCLEVQRRALLNLLPVLPWGEVVFLVFNAIFVWSRMYWIHEIQKSELQSIGRWIKHINGVIL